MLLLCWRDTGHPQGGGSETYLQRIGAQLAESGVRVTLRTARYRGASRTEVVDGIRISRGGGRLSVYIWAGLAMVLARVGLADKSGNYPAELSGGQQQRVAIARALVTDPALILADEPTGNLDSVSTEDVLNLMDELHAAGRTIVLITHEADVAARAERVVRVFDGRIASIERRADR